MDLVRFDSRSSTSSVDVKLLIMLRVSRFGTSIGLCALDDDSFLARLVDFRPGDQVLGSMYPPGSLLDSSKSKALLW